MLLALVITLLIALVWLAGRYEASQVQQGVERDAGDAVNDVRTMLTRNLQDIQALQASSAATDRWRVKALELLRNHRELLNLEWRDAALMVTVQAESPFHPLVFSQIGRKSLQSDVAVTCSNAKRFTGPAYSVSYFMPQEDGVGQEIMDMCLPLMAGARVTGFVVATYSLGAILRDTVSPQLTRGHEVSFTETDGTRLVLHGSMRRGTPTFTARQVLTLPGNTLMLRLDSWRTGSYLFPNVLTALVTLLSIALLSVLGLLGRDARRRMQAERNLADALAFRKAMEDSLVTGLLARDHQGKIRYANPAFCQMVGYSTEELLLPSPGHADAPSDVAPDGVRPSAVSSRHAAGTAPQPSTTTAPVPTASPFWPLAEAEAYYQKLTVREGDGGPNREGLETVFVHKDGTHFPVLVFDAPLINALGSQTGWMSAFVDITEQRRMEELSRASQDRLQATARLATVGEMASLLSHELNQPLAAISSYATGGLNMLNDRNVPSFSGELTMVDLQGALQRIAEQAERAGKVIKSVHNFVRRREGDREPVQPASLLEAIMLLVGLRAHKLGVQVQIQVADDLPLVVCDRTMVEQVLLNLARNGMQAMEHLGVESRVLAFAVQRDATQRNVEFSVADGGLGISDEVARQLFTPFFTTKAEGMGLGLSLCRTVIEQHRGMLEFENRSPRGTIFKFTLPLPATAL